MSATRQRPTGLDWLDLARAGNFPSVASNVLAAFVLSARGADFEPNLVAGALLGGALAYAGGATLNDVADHTFDAQHRPERALPRGAVSRRAAAIVGAVELLAGAAVLVAFGAHWAGATSLVALVALYNWLHKRWAGAVALIAGCRAALALTVATLPGHHLAPGLLLWVAALWCYIVVLSVLARREYRPRAAAARLAHVVRWLLAGIPLVDATALLVLGAWPWALVCAAMIPLGRGAQRLLAAD
ncbi:MAG TPA: UbiA family prenyltransferase [Opitutaceae bacterium]|nr:UbiA family prenyltransferase [Opitutaceae bacterium]